MTTFKAMFGIEVFQAWCELYLERDVEEPTDMADYFSRLHTHLVRQAKKERTKSAKEYDKTVKKLKYQVGVRVILWNMELRKSETNKPIKQISKAFIINEKLGSFGDMLQA